MYPIFALARMPAHEDSCVLFSACDCDAAGRELAAPQRFPSERVGVNATGFDWRKSTFAVAKQIRPNIAIGISACRAIIEPNIVAKLWCRKCKLITSVYQIVWALKFRTVIQIGRNKVPRPTGPTPWCCPSSLRSHISIVISIVLHRLCAIGSVSNASYNHLKCALNPLRGI